MRDLLSHDQIRALKEGADLLEVNDSILIECPFCRSDWEQQGRPIEWQPRKSCKLTRTMAGILYICYRASCDKHGIIADIPPQFSSSVKKFIPKQVTCDLVSLPDNIWKEMLFKYGLTKSICKEHGYKYAPSEDALYIPLYNPYGYLIGEQLKFRDRTHDPKVLTFRHKEAPLLHFPPQDLQRGDSLVLVEDAISASKVSRLIPTAALNSSSLSDDAVLQLRKLKFKQLIFFLDNDAINKAYKMGIELQGFFAIKVINTPAGKDPKDLSFPSLEILITE